MHHKIIPQHLATIFCYAHQHIKVKNASIKILISFSGRLEYLYIKKKKITGRWRCSLTLICIRFCCHQVTRLWTVCLSVCSLDTVEGEASRKASLPSCGEKIWHQSAFQQASHEPPHEYCASGCLSWRGRKREGVCAAGEKTEVYLTRWSLVACFSLGTESEIHRWTLRGREQTARWVTQQERLYISFTEHFQREFIIPGQVWPSWFAAQTQKSLCALWAHRRKHDAAVEDSAERVFFGPLSRFFIHFKLVWFLNEVKEVSWCPVELWTLIPAENKENVIFIETIWARAGPWNWFASYHKYQAS